MKSQTGQKIIMIHMLPDITRSEDNQVMKSGHLIEYPIVHLFSFGCFQKFEVIFIEEKPT